MTKHKSGSAGEAVAHIFDKLVERFLPDEAVYPKRAEKFWKDTKFWCSFMGGTTYTYLNALSVLEFQGENILQIEDPIRSLGGVYPILFYSLYYGYQLFLLVFYSWLVYHMSEKVGRLRAYFLGLLIPTIVFYSFSIFS